MEKINKEYYQNKNIEYIKKKQKFQTLETLVQGTKNIIEDNEEGKD